MPLLITPGQLNHRSEFYHQLSVFISSGISVPQALVQLERNPPSRAFRPHIAQLLAHLQDGDTFTHAVQRMGNWIPSFDVALLEAGDRSGRLDACCKLLSVYYSERALLVRQTISDLMYPAFTFHFAIVLFPFLEFFNGGTLTGFLVKTLGVLGPLYAAIFFLIYACQGRHGERWRALIERLLHPVPLLGTARRQLAIARLSAALEALLNAGVSIVNAWELAATASGSPAIRATVLNWKEPLATGCTPSELVSRSNLFPEMFANLYHTGEISGKLDETLARLHTVYQSEGSRKLHMFSQWTPRILYFGVLIYCAFKIISFYVGYFNQVGQIIDGK